MRIFLILSLFFFASLCSYSQSIVPAGPTGFCTGGSVLLTVVNYPAGATFQWQLNNTNIDGQVNSSHTATEPGGYTVLVTSNGTATYGPTVVTESDPPAATFTFSPNNQCSNQPIQFTNTSTGGAGLTYTWNFDDPASGSSNTSTAVNPIHTFVGTPGNGTQNFTATLTANNAGCTSTYTSQITTNQLPNAKLGGTGFTTYNGLPYFTQCTSIPSNFNFTNQSSTSSTNTNYVIIWGDGSTNFTATTFTATTHNYPVGNYQLQFIVTGQNGCKDTGRYNVFVGSNPAVGLNNPGNTFICSQTSLTFPVTGTGNNPPGTVYTVLFNDGSAPAVFNHPAPASVTHLFNNGSCGINSPGFPNSFQATIQASNPCGTSAASVVPIYVSEKTKAIMGIQPDTVVCTNTNVTFTNISGSGFGVSSNGVCIPGKGLWTISPTSGWSLISGDFGNDFGLNDPSVWDEGSIALSIRFDLPGNYTIKLKTGATELCGGDSVIRTICVNPAPVAAFSLPALTGCAPFNVKPTNTSNTPLCKTNTYQWTVIHSNSSGCLPNTLPAYTFLNGTSATSATPEFQFTNPGIYTITLITKNSGGLCTSAPVSQTVTVKTKPTATVTSPSAVCQNGAITPTAIANNCLAETAATYLWEFPGGSPSTSTSLNPGTITYTTPGSYTISFTVTNECGSTIVTKTITVNAAPDVTVPAPQTFCAGVQTGNFTFGSAVPGATFAWTNNNPAIGLPAAGTGSINSFVTINNTNAPITAIITVTPVSGCSGNSQSFTITVNPRPQKPVVVRPVIYCLNEPAVPLNATATAGNALTWYTAFPLTGGTITPPTPSTASAANTTYYVTQSNSYNCESDTSKITVIVNPLITNNTISADQTLCNGSTAQPLTGTSANGGSGSYSFQWQHSIDGGIIWSNIPTAVAATYNPGNVTTDTRYRRIVNSASCTDTSNVVSITVQGSLTNAGITGAQTICSGAVPAPLLGEAPSGGNSAFTYQWESSMNNIAWTIIDNETAQDYAPPALTTSTYFRRKVSSGQCAVYSLPVLITVNPTPVIAAIADNYFCNNTPSGTIAFSVTPVSSTVTWINNNTGIGLAATGTGNIVSFVTTNYTNPKIPVSALIKVAPVYTSNNIGCPGDTVSFKIYVLPFISIATIPNEVKCTGALIPAFTPVPDTGTFAGIGVTYSWTVTGTGTTLTNGTGAQIPSYTTINNSATDAITTITVTPQYTYNGKTCSGNPSFYTITVKPATASANAGADAVLCNAATANLSAAIVNGTTGIWSQLGTTATIVAPMQNSTVVNGLLPGTIYKFVWTQSGFADCPATTDTVIIDNKLPLINKIDTTTKIICAGGSVTINGGAPTGGGNNYTYQWESSTDGINYSTITGDTLQNITVTPTATIWLRRFVNAPPCSGYSDTAHIIVQLALANNIITGNSAICIGSAAPQITGSTPTGGNNDFSYVWEQSINGGAVWTTIGTATGINYSPGTLNTTTLFRRRLETTLCSGAFGSVSNAVTITVNPNATALFIPTDTVRCPPFVITPAVINVQTSAANSQYLWYADDVLIGSGAFPGFTISTENDSVVIKLKTISAYGCINDSLSKTFRTLKQPIPSFTLSDTAGCGPITVQAINTSSYMTEFTYLWDFGNGQTSTQAQPPQIIFTPNLNYNDTVYTVTLKVFSACDTITVQKNILVKSGPKALFTPGKTSGCSPMTVQFQNTSKGLNNTYFWNFGDGTTLTTTTPDAVEHTFITGVVDTFYVSLKAVNECSADSITYSIVVTPNTIRLNLAINGTDRYGCAPHTVAFFNNSQGASAFVWNFGDGATTTSSKNTDTIYHTYLTPGNYTASVRGTNNCSDTTAFQSITVYPKPTASFIINKYTACKGDTLRFTNLSDSATAYVWQFGDGTTSTLQNPFHVYNTAGNYTVTLISYRNNPSGNICTDSASKNVQIEATQPGWFTASDSVSLCAPLTVVFENGNKPSVSTLWNFGDGTTATGDSVVHTFTTPGIYIVTLTTTVPGGCIYLSQKTITVAGPGGALQYTGGFTCLPNAVRLQAVATGATSYIWNFGDGTTQTTTSQIVFHTYTEPGLYVPAVTLQNSAGCNITIAGSDTIKADAIDAGFTVSQQQNCGFTTVNFTDTSHVFFGKESIRWNFGDGTTGTGLTTSHTYTAGGTYAIQLIIKGNSGCADTIQKQVTITVNAKPVISINAPAIACTNAPIQFTGVLQSADAINITQWVASNGTTGTGPVFNPIFNTPGLYTVQLIAGTANGCFDTAVHTIQINPSPVVTATPSLNICSGAGTQLNAIGAATYQWLPLQGLSCYTCPSPLASPVVTTPYVVEGKNSFGCAAYDTVVVTVIQPLQLLVSGNDSICIGQSVNLSASGASSYSWSPAQGLDNTSISNPTASPTVTTTYRVVGYDGFNCFTDTAFITIGVGKYPTINLGPDLTLATGTLHPLTSVVTNGPIRNWVWSPSTNLNCTTCPTPVAEIKKDITYSVIATTAYGCPASDTISIKAFCQESQVFVPNAFTPDNDGTNDILMVRSKGIVQVKTFRIFNRWGELIFERSNFTPNSPAHGWDGKVKGQKAGPDVFVYTYEVICENGTLFTNKGNVSIIQ